MNCDGMRRFTFLDDSDMLSQFRSIDTSVPPRTERRPHRSIEWYCLRRYLLPLAHCGVFVYPLEVVENESPDFDLIDPRTTVGLEITQITTEDYQRFMTRIQRSQQKIAMYNTRGYVGDSSERDWCELTVDSLARKSHKLADYRAADRYELLLYDNSEFPVDLHRAIGYLRSRLPAVKGSLAGSRSFQVVSVFRSTNLVYDIGGVCKFLSYRAEWD